MSAAAHGGMGMTGMQSSGFYSAGHRAAGLNNSLVSPAATAMTPAMGMGAMGAMGAMGNMGAMAGMGAMGGMGGMGGGTAEYQQMFYAQQQARVSAGFLSIHRA